MASPIIVYDRIDRKTDPRSAVKAAYQALFLYAVNPPVLNALGQTQIVTPSASLPAGAPGLLSAGEISGLDSGSLGFESLEFEQGVSQPLADLVATAQALYPARKAEFLARQRDRYQYAGQRIAVPGESV